MSLIDIKNAAEIADISSLKSLNARNKPNNRVKSEETSPPYKTLSTFTAMLKMPLEKMGVFTQEEKNISDLLKATKFMSKNYADITIESTEKYDLKKFYMLKLKLAEYEINKESAEKILQAFVNGKLDASNLKIIEPKLKGLKMKSILAAPETKPTITNILARLVGENMISEKTAVTLDTIYRTAQKILATGVALIGISVMVASFGIALSPYVWIAIAAIAAIAIVVVMAEEGINAYSKIETNPQSQAWTENTKEGFKKLYQLFIKDGLGIDLATTISLDLINPFKEILKATA